MCFFFHILNLIVRLLHVYRFHFTIWRTISQSIWVSNIQYKAWLIIGHNVNQALHFVDWYIIKYFLYQVDMIQQKRQLELMILQRWIFWVQLPKQISKYDFLHFNVLNFLHSSTWNFNLLNFLHSSTWNWNFGVCNRRP